MTSAMLVLYVTGCFIKRPLIYIKMNRDRKNMLGIIGQRMNIHRVEKQIIII